MPEILSIFDSITLNELDDVSLLNRTDTKFVTHVSKMHSLLQLAVEDYRVLEVDGGRISPYHTLYFDTPDKAMYCKHEAGHTNRQKVRVRSYIKSGLSFLEVKTKDNHGRTCKERMPMKDFDPMDTARDIMFRSQDDEFKLYDDFLETHLWYDPNTLGEHLTNRFNRITLVNREKTERVTIDFGLQFNNILTGKCLAMDKVAIIELKRDGFQPSAIMGMLNTLRIKPMGFSKYVIGSALTNEHLRCNRIKPNLRRISQLSSY